MCTDQTRALEMNFAASKQNCQKLIIFSTNKHAMETTTGAKLGKGRMHLIDKLVAPSQSYVNFPRMQFDG